MSENKSNGVLTPIVRYIKDFGVLRDNPMVYWAVQIINLLDSAAYFALLAIGTVFFTTNMGLNDVHTGYVVATMTIATTLILLGVGAFTDWLGIRKSMFLAIGLQTVSRGGLALMGLWAGCPGRLWLAIGFFMLTAPGMAMTITVFQSANRRFSSKRSRSASFSLWYMIMNLGAAVAGYLIIDGVRLWFEIDNSHIFTIGFFCGLLSLLTAILLIRGEKQVTDKEEDAEEATSTNPPQEKLGFIKNLKTVIGQTSFHRLLVLMVAVLGVRAIFAYAYLLMPKYWIRVIGPDVEMGFLSAVNPICIVIGIILTIPIIGRFNIFKVLVFGAIISSLSLFVLTLPWSWFGGDVASGYFNMAVIMMVVLSIGEILWSPKLNEYTAAIAPKGMEGTYLGMSMAPWFIAKTLVSFASGHMLSRWCPEGIGEPIRAGSLSFWDSPEAMWFWLFLWAVIGVAIVIIFGKWLTAGTDLNPTKKTAA
ncbi:MAG: Major facilitator superfamily [Candidatus Uhrbacteria bacterium GW2011_GWE2_45_35]|uniref:Major facilitator superfamily n=2 Tax=Candidatus Uhriibacteriota TaxID=1752732 RepID=A0A0G1M850_9BACT|nr:MAG: Major facilitator superfamily [Candidatus Uhrbacteria bacterium GW2011_GWF2_44_350]KKU05783.1 MAG: Major facilitator superfamily [Candidatus Uhrbacteria bacterium GW2011_GWE2_45_35]HBR80894.1 hypothetical protein [Candidatus Uhrbacteria bacterium]HCU31423.1 hypothetical protein [Candidatus Uhrbacteria bacterium]